MTSAPIPSYPIFSKRFKVITDANNFAIGAVLTKEDHPITFASRNFNRHKTHYSTIEEELLAIVWHVKCFLPYKLMFAGLKKMS